MEAGDIERISQPSVSRIISRFSTIICRNVRNFIKFPSTPDDLFRTKAAFYTKYRMPNVIGLIDGSLISIKGPSGEREPLYVSRKGGHAINVQVICDANMYITDIVARWPGATHDSFIWRNSGMRERFLQNPPNGYFLGNFILQFSNSFLAY